MMRLARRASLLVSFYLLTSAATAYAECAWVLWSEDSRLLAGEWTRHAVYQITQHVGPESTN